jgi:hypothetical protein
VAASQTGYTRLIGHAGRWRVPAGSRGGDVQERSMPEEICLRYRYTADEYASAIRTHFARVLKTRRSIIVSLMALVIGVVLRSIPVAGMSLLLMLMIFAVNYIVPRMWFRQEPKIRDEYRLRFAEDGIVFQTAQIDSQIRWELYNRIVESDRFFLLYFGKRSFTIIPKRAFAGVEQEARFREMLRRHVPPENA